MTDEMGIQSQRPSATPYLLTGAVLGSGVGYGANRFGWDRFYKPQSWADAVEDVNKNDKFIKAQIEKGGENVSALETIQAEAENVSKAKKALADIKLPEGSAKAELDALVEATIKYENATEVEAKNQAKEALDKVLETFNAKNKGENAIDTELVNSYKNASKNLANASKKAEETLTKDILSKYKIGNKWLTMGIGAAALALGALAIRPKGE